MFVFVLMPFDEKLTEIYKKVVKPTLEAEGCTVRRADEFSSPQNILKDIIPNIFRADLIVAELTNKNPNVYYELGIAHTFSKPTILLVQDVEELLFDLASYRAIPYSENYADIEKLKITLRSTVQTLKNGTGEFGNPVSDNLPGLEMSLVSTVDPAEEKPVAKNLMDETKDVEIALRDIFHSIVRQASLLSGLGSYFSTFTELVKLATTTPPNLVLFQESVEGLDRGLREYAAEVAKELPSMRSNWEVFKRGFVTIISTSSLTTEQDIEALRDLKNQLGNLVSQIEGALPSIKGYISTLGKLNEREKNLHPSVENVQSILDEQYEIYFIGNAYLVRVINLIERKLS